MRRFLPAGLILLCAACGRNPVYYLENGRKLAAGGKYEEAALNYRRALQGRPDYGDAEYGLGLAFGKLGKQPEAYQALSHAVELLPERDDVKVALADLSLSGYLADRLRPRFLHDKVAALSDQLLAENISSYDGLRLKGHLALADRDPKAAAGFYSKADSLRPMQPEVVVGWVQALFQDGKSTDAEALAPRLIAADKAYQPIYETLYRYYMSANRMEDAARILRTRTLNNPADARSAIELAAFYAVNSKEAEMKAELGRLLDNPRAFPRAHLLVGNFYSGLQRWDAALAQYEAGAASDPKQRIVYLKRIADAWLAQGKGEQAYQVVGEILKENPHDDAARAVNAAFLVTTRNRDNIAKAVSTLQDLVTKSPENPVWHLYLGKAMAASGNAAGAQNQFAEAVKKNPDLLAARVAMAELSLAQGDYERTLQYADQILKDHPDFTRIGVLRAVSLMYFGRDIDAARELAALERTAPHDRDVRMQAAALDLHEKKFREAERGFEELIGEQNTDAAAWNGLVASLAAENQRDRAIPLLVDGLRKSPDSMPLRSILARTAAQAGNYDLAIEQYRLLLAASPNSPQLNLDLGNVYRLQGNLPAAISAFEKAATLAPGDAAAPALLGGVLALTGRNEEALGSYRRAMQLAPASAAVLNATAWLIAETGGDLDEALRLALQATRMDANQPNFSDTLGWVYFRKNMNEAAIQVFRGLTQKYPGQPTFHYHLGMALLRKGERAAARSELKSALSEKPPVKVRHEIEAALAQAG